MPAVYQVLQSNDNLYALGARAKSPRRLAETCTQHYHLFRVTSSPDGEALGQGQRSRFDAIVARLHRELRCLDPRGAEVFRRVIDAHLAREGQRPVAWEECV